jgi:steroid delta-isomerase-like uncharacterized protein
MESVNIVGSISSVSRRAALGRLGAGGLGLALAGRLASAAAQGASPTAGAAPAIVQAWIAGWNGPDPAATVAALYTSDGIYEDVSSGTQSKSGDVRGFLTPFAQGTADLTVELTDAFATSDWAAAEYRFSETNQGAFPGAVGKRFRVRGVTVYQLADGKIRRSSDYTDTLAILIQLGAIPAPGASASPAS